MFYFNGSQMAKELEDVTFYAFSLSILFVIVGLINVMAFISPATIFFVR